MAGLTEQELGLLMIHQNGGNVAAIGHWEKPCDHLVELGYLLRIDKHNHEITLAGREVAEQEENDTYRKMVEIRTEMRGTQAGIGDFAEQAARLLAEAAKESSKVTGDDAKDAARKWSGIILRRALDLLDG